MSPQHKRIFDEIYFLFEIGRTLPTSRSQSRKESTVRSKKFGLKEAGTPAL